MYYRILLSFLLVVAAGCQKEPDSGVPGQEDLAKTINSVTDGLMRPDAQIEVGFVSKQARDDQIGETLKVNPFILSPDVDGLAKWTEHQTLAFVPSKALTRGRTYEVSLNLDQVQGTSTGRPPFVFKVTVARRELVDLTAEFVSVGDDPAKAELKGTLSFNQPADITSLRRAVTVRDDKQTHQVAWSGEGLAFQFIVTGLKRGNDTQRFWIKVDPEALEIPAGRELTVDLPKLNVFEVSSLAAEQEGSGYLVRIAMSDPLAQAQDVKSFITIDPVLDFKATYVGKRITVAAGFERGKTYKITVQPGIKSQWGVSLAKPHEDTITTYDLPPSIQFSQGGVFLPTESKNRLAFRTTNVNRVHVEVSQVFEDNLGQFLQQSSLQGSASGQNYYNIHPVGISIHRQTVELDPPKNANVQSELDLSNVIAKKKGLFIVELRFTREDVPFRCKEREDVEQGRTAYAAYSDWYWDGPDDYYNNPCQNGFWYQHSKVRRPVIVSDVGLTVKQTRDELWIAATNIETAEPLPAVRVSSFTYQQQEIASATTGTDGTARLKIDPKQSAFYVEATRGGQRTAIKLNESALDLSTFDVGGHYDASATRAFVYTERGVYRPGDPIRVTAILRNDDNTFPRNHPLELRFFNPRGKQSTSITHKDAKDGVYVFELKTETSSYTGTWNAQFFLGSERIATQPIKVETVVPPRLKVKMEAVADPVPPGATEAKAHLEAKYLFGAPAKGLKTEVTADLYHRRRTFPDFKQFVFDASATTFKPVTTTIHEGPLSDDGTAEVSWTLPGMSRAPSDFQLTMTAKVFEKGGRFTNGQVSMKVEPWERYVGLKFPATSVQVDEPTSFHMVVVGRDGKPVAGQKLKVKVYSNQRRWWWQLRQSGDPAMKFKSDKDSILIAEETVTSGKKPVPFTFTPKERGQLMIEVRDGEDGHLANAFLQQYRYSYGRAQTDAPKNATHLLVRTDKSSYAPGDTAKISFESPKLGNALLTIEKNGLLLSHRWVKISAAETTLSVPITEQMLPNVYAALSFFQPHAETVSDRPIRMYGVAPVNVESKKTELDLSVEVADELRPQKPFAVKIKSNDSRPAQVTVAVVDEGLLSLTNFKTPDPKGYFYAKRPIGVQTFDMFDQVIGAIWGDIHRRFSIGGGDEEDRKQVAPVTARRFEPVSLFAGPIDVPAKGEVTIDFEMPNYNGAVRVMVVGAHKGAFASIEHTRPVRAPLILLPTLPRVTGPTDSFNVPVTIFALKEKIGKTEIVIKVQGPIEVEGPTKHTVEFGPIGENDVDFRLKGARAVGVATVEINAKAQKYSAHYKTELAVRPSSPADTERIDQIIDPGKSWTQALKPRGLGGTHKAELVLSGVPNLNFKHRFHYLIHYPYGCSEQITSAAFPQLFVSDLFPTMLRASQVDRNVNAAITKLAGHQLHDGSFKYWYGYWQGHKEYHRWLTNYVGHFLGLAKEKGYYVPPDVLEKWVRYQNGVAATGDGDLAHVYTLFTLAQAGKPALGPMNALREDRFKSMSNPARVLLAGAYHTAGLTDVAKGILEKVDDSVVEKQDFDRTFGSTLRDEAIMLVVLSKVGQRERAWKLYEKITQQLNGRYWYSTQTVAWGLYAASVFVKEFGLGKTPLRLAIENGGETKEIDSRNYLEVVPLKVGSKLVVTSSSEKPVFASVVHEYVPLEPPKEAVADNIGLQVDYFDENGTEIDPTSLPQGKSFWAVLRVIAQSELSINNVALTQVLPAGWEIENTRMSGEGRPSWLNYRGWFIGNPEYTDIRDDRIMWFFDLHPKRYYGRWKDKKPGLAFAVKLNTVAVGEYTLPPGFAEAMYNADYRARLTPGTIKVTQQ